MGNKKIFLIGAGRSATDLIDYILNLAEKEGWYLKVGDYNEAVAKEKVENHPCGEGFHFNVYDEDQRRELIRWADICISLLPPHMHIIPAKDCLRYDTHMVTASYVTKEMAALDYEAKEKGLIFLNEMGADPGIDHMSGMEMIHRVRREGGVVKAFRSYCGALISPEYNNIWGYKFTWAPQNIILAGQGGVAKYIRDGRVRYLPYHRLFKRTDKVHVPGYGDFIAYANRDSMKYQRSYELEDIETLYRATLRMPGFCKGWSVFVELGLTSTEFVLPNSEGMTYGDFLFSFINERPGKTREETFAEYLGEPLDGPNMEKFRWLGLFGEETIPLVEATPAEILQHILERKWVFEEGDIDMIVMQHQVEYIKNAQRHKLTSSMGIKGKNQEHTAISLTVGLPVAIGAKLILHKSIPQKGVIIPIYKEIYEPALKELEEYGVVFQEEDVMLEAAVAH